jgi:Mrp family chromosome partitioning ATPase
MSVTVEDTSHSTQPAAGRTEPTAKPKVKAPLVSKDAALIDALILKLQNYQNEKELGSLAVGISSSRNATGVSTLAVHCAQRAAYLGLGNVLLIDGNLGRPSLHRWIARSESSAVGKTRASVKNNLGLADAVIDPSVLDSAIYKTADLDLDVLAAGSSGHRDIAFSPANLQPIFQELRTRYQTIFVDIPSFDDVGNSFFLANQMDGIVLVVDSKKTKSRDSKKLIGLLQENSIEVLGAVLNRYQSPLPKFISRWL